MGVPSWKHKVKYQKKARKKEKVRYCLRKCVRQTNGETICIVDGDEFYS